MNCRRWHINLELILLDDLITELGNRFEHFVFSSMQTKIGGEDKILTFRKWKGNPATCCGLCSQLQIVITNKQLEENELTEDNQLPL